MTGCVALAYGSRLRRPRSFATTVPQRGPRGSQPLAAHAKQRLSSLLASPCGVRSLLRPVTGNLDLGLAADGASALRPVEIHEPLVPLELLTFPLRVRLHVPIMAHLVPLVKGDCPYCAPDEKCAICLGVCPACGHRDHSDREACDVRICRGHCPCYGPEGSYQERDPAKERS